MTTDQNEKKAQENEAWEAHRRQQTQAGVFRAPLRDNKRDAWEQAATIVEMWANEQKRLGGKNVGYVLNTIVPAMRKRGANIERRNGMNG